MDDYPEPAEFRMVTEENENPEDHSSQSQNHSERNCLLHRAIKTDPRCIQEYENDGEKCAQTEPVQYPWFDVIAVIFS